MAGQCRALGQRLQLGPGEIHVDAPAEAAIGAGDHVFAARHLGEAADAVGHQFGMLDYVGGVADDAGDEDFPLRQLGVLPDPPFMFATTPGTRGIRNTVRPVFSMGFWIFSPSSY